MRIGGARAHDPVIRIWNPGSGPSVLLRSATASSFGTVPRGNDSHKPQQVGPVLLANVRVGECTISDPLEVIDVP